MDYGSSYKYEGGSSEDEEVEHLDNSPIDSKSSNGEYSSAKLINEGMVVGFNTVPNRSFQ
jgi:hypothetical protein